MPRPKSPKLIVVVAFDSRRGRELIPAFGPADQQSEERAVGTSKALEAKHFIG